MTFGDEKLMELRTQLVEAGHGDDESHAIEGERCPSCGAAAGAARGHGLEPRHRDKFLGEVGHWIRSPIQTIAMTLDLMTLHASPDDPPWLKTARMLLAGQIEFMGRMAIELFDSPRSAEQLHERLWQPDIAPDKPPDEPPARSGSSGSPVSHALRSRLILVVDDNEDAAEMMALVLRKRGYRVVLAFDGEEALAMAAEHHPDVVLLDIGLPGIDGYEVARRLRATATTKRPVLVAVTGYGQPADRERAREAGFDHHLVKPVAMDELLPLFDPSEPEPA